MSINLNVDGNLSLGKIRELNPKRTIDLNTDNLPKNCKESFLHALQKTMDEKLTAGFSLDPRFEAEIYANKINEDRRGGSDLLAHITQLK